MTPDRNLEIHLDGETIEPLSHVRLSAVLEQSLFPYPCYLRIWNPPDRLHYRFMRSKYIEVLHGETVLASGEYVDSFLEIIEEGSLLTVVFSLGYSFWQKYVSFSVSVGTTASDTVRLLLAAGGSDFQLLREPEKNPVFSRPQAFYGRLADAVGNVLSACEVVPYMTPAGIDFREKGEPGVQTILDLDSVSGVWTQEEILL